MTDPKKWFSKTLLKWNNEANMRQMPWKGEKDPYKIWLSEIILQQTRVEQGWEYYNRFVKAFPKVEQLAAAPETKVFKLWEGLGYYSRCKNLIATAQIITATYKGKFPADYQNILNLKGVGPYTAAAIASFAFNLPHAVVDGNVYRVLARFFGLEIATDSTAGKKVFTTLAQELIDKKKPAAYNQAIMDFGAVICKPKLPLCTSCPLKNKCVAFATARVALLPVKEKKITVKKRWFYYTVAYFENKVMVHKRGAKDIWENLYEFMLHESDAPLSNVEVLKLPVLQLLTKKNNKQVQYISAPYQQKLTHQTIYCQFIKIELQNKPVIDGFEMVTAAKLLTLPFPKIITTYLKDKNVSLNLM